MGSVGSHVYMGGLVPQHNIPPLHQFQYWWPVDGGLSGALVWVLWAKGTGFQRASMDIVGRMDSWPGSSVTQAWQLSHSGLVGCQLSHSGLVGWQLRAGGLAAQKLPEILPKAGERVC